MVTEYQQNLVGASERPDFLLKKVTRKKPLAPPYARANINSLKGAGIAVLGDSQEGSGAYNPNTRAYYNGRKRQYNIYNQQLASAYANNLPNPGINIKANLNNQRTPRE